MTFINDQSLSGPTIHDVTDTLQGNDMTDRKIQPTASGAAGITLSQDLVVPVSLFEYIFSIFCEWYQSHCENWQCL